MLKKFMIAVTVVMATVSLCACGEEDKNSTINETKANTATEKQLNGDDFEKVDLSKAGWTMSMDNVMIAAELSNTSEVLGYSSASSTTFEQSAAEGNTYVLFKMTIAKDGASENINWENMILTDAEGNTYNRIDDSFIDSLTWKRISGTDLNFGTNEGWFAYEIPEDKAGAGLVLSYQFESEKMEYKVN